MITSYYLYTVCLLRYRPPYVAVDAFRLHFECFQLVVDSHVGKTNSPNGQLLQIREKRLVGFMLLFLLFTEAVACHSPSDATV